MGNENVQPTVNEPFTYYEWRTNETETANVVYGEPQLDEILNEFWELSIECSDGQDHYVVWDILTERWESGEL